MKIVVAGCRYYDNYDEARKFIDHCINGMEENTAHVILSGGCKGADKLGERYAKENGYDIITYKAEWSRYRGGAGPIRNKAMAEAADLVICFWDGESNGTKSMIECAKKAGKPVRIKTIPPEN